MTAYKALATMQTMEQEIIQQTLAKAKRFNADPATHAPCIECGAPVAREGITPENVCCTASCFRRFKARMKEQGLHPVAVADRWFVDVFGISRGRSAPYKRELLPKQEAHLLYFTGTLKSIEEYKQGGIFGPNCF